MLEQVKKRLKSFGYEIREGDEALLEFSVQKTENTIKNECNVPTVPEGLKSIAVDMAAGEFLTFKKTFAPGDLAGMDWEPAVKQIQEGDTSVVFATGEASLTQEQRLSAFLNYLLAYGREEFSCYRRLRW